MVRCTWSASVWRCSRSPTATTYLPSLVLKLLLQLTIVQTVRTACIPYKPWSTVQGKQLMSSALFRKMHISSSSPELLTFFKILHDLKIQDDGSRHLVFSGGEFDHSGVLIVWHLCSVPNLVQISVIVTEIDALMLQTFIWWRHAN